MDVPGHDNRLGFGGPCFPKDTKALYEIFTNQNKEFQLLKKAIYINNKLRNKYNDLSKREIDQNTITIMIFRVCPSGGIGRHKGLKIPR